MCKLLQQVKRHNRDIFSISNNMKVCYVFSLKSPHPGDSTEITQHTLINIRLKSPEIIPNTIKSAAMVFFFCWRAKNEFEIAVVSEPSVFEPH